MLNVEAKYRPANRKPIFITTSMNSLTRVLDSMSPLTTLADERFEKESKEARITNFESKCIRNELDNHVAVLFMATKIIVMDSFPFIRLRSI